MSADQTADALARALGIPVAADAAEEEIVMTEKRTEEVKTAKVAKAVKKSKPVKKTTAKRERKPREEGLMVFAFRITKAESEALHRAAGPANASRTMRALAAAFAAEDPDGFKAVVTEARKLRA